MASAGIRKTPSGRYKVWWRLDDTSQGSQTFDTRDAARDFMHDLLASVARDTWVDPRRGKQPFVDWARQWWDTWSSDPDRSPTTLEATEARFRLHVLPYFEHRSFAPSPSLLCAAGRTSSRPRGGAAPSWPPARSCTASSRRPRTSG
jgi:hypothetical protein